MNKKIILIAFISILIIILLTWLGYSIYTNHKYSLGNVKLMLEEEKNATNLHKIEEYIQDDNVYTVNTYIKGNSEYTVAKTSDEKTVSEVFINNSERITVLNEPKIILKGNSNDLNFSTLNNSNFTTVCEKITATYKYIGKETINQNKCIKVCITNEYSGSVEQDYYYIDEENHTLIKHESYEGDSLNNLSKKMEENYTYLYDSVTDDDIIHFDANNYSDYQYYN